MAIDEPHPSSPTHRTGGTVEDAARSRPRFGLKCLLLLPVLAAAILMVDRWTAIPWAGPKRGGPLVFKIVDGTTGRPYKGATLTMFEGGTKRFAMPATFGVVRHFGGNTRPSGYRSLFQDTRRLEVGDMRIKVAADGFESFEADGAEISRNARPTPDDSGLEYVVRLHRRHE